MNLHLDLGDDAFTGAGGGLFTAGGGFLYGTLYGDVATVVADTRSFEVNATPVYVNVTFFDSAHRPLGMIQAGAGSTILGIGGGRGRWTAG